MTTKEFRTKLRAESNISEYGADTDYCIITGNPKNPNRNNLVLSSIESIGFIKYMVEVYNAHAFGIDHPINSELDPDHKVDAHPACLISVPGGECHTRLSKYRQEYADWLANNKR